MAFNSKNPFLNNKSFSPTSASQKEKIHNATVIDYNQDMTLSGTINKSFILFLLLTASATIIWWLTFNGMNPLVPAIGGAIVGFILVLISVFKPQYSGYLAPGYALFEGLFIGGISAIFETMYPGIVIQAVGATLITFGVCLALYKYQIVKVTEQFKSVVVAATLAIVSPPNKPDAAPNCDTEPLTAPLIAPFNAPCPMLPPYAAEVIAPIALPIIAVLAIVAAAISPAVAAVAAAAPPNSSVARIPDAAPPDMAVAAAIPIKARPG